LRAAKKGSIIVPRTIKIESSAQKAINNLKKFFYLKAAVSIGIKFMRSGSYKATNEGGVMGLSLITRASPIAANETTKFCYQNKLLVAFIVS
jgi:hypothetical protein